MYGLIVSPKFPLFRIINFEFQPSLLRIGWVEYCIALTMIYEIWIFSSLYMPPLSREFLFPSMDTSWL